MGSQVAEGFAEEVRAGHVALEQAIAYHLTSNHYPPVPTSMVPVCITAIQHAEDGDWDAEVELPEGITYKDGATSAPVHAIMEQHHLDAFMHSDVM